MGQLNDCVHYKKVRMNENPFKLAFKKEVVTALLEYGCFVFFTYCLWIILLKYYCENFLVLSIFLYILPTLKYYDSQGSNKKLKLTGGAMIFFSKKVTWSWKYLALWSPGLQKFFGKFVKPSGPTPTYVW